MKSLSVTLFTVLVCTALLLTALSAATAPTLAQEPEPLYPIPSPTDSAPPSDGGPYRAQDGTWYMPAEPAPPMASSASVVPQATGGPDGFGYTWDDTVGMDWIDATVGTNTGLSQGSSGASLTGAIPLGFEFKFYENAYTEVYISSAGAIGFDPESLEGRTTTSYVPSPPDPNDFIAPYLAPLRLNSWGYGGQVYYLRSGTAPNRYLVVEWHQVTDGIEGSFTFQVVLRENGDILFQYLSMEHGRGYYCDTVAGIEDETGRTGLAYVQSSCNNMENVSGKAVLFDRPAPSARVSVWPVHQGRFTAPGETVAFQLSLRNTGELGSDTYDILVSSAWSVGLYGADGTTLLTDTDGDGTVDTGSLAEGDAVTITAEVTTPVTAGLGDANAAAITVRSSLDTSKSKVATLQTAIPAPFAQAYVDDADGAMSVDLVQPAGQAAKQATPDQHHGNDVAVAEMPDGFAYFWTKYEWADGVGTRAIEYNLLDRYGETMRGLTRLTDHSGATVSTYDHDAAVAVAPNGRIGVVWQRYLYDSSSGTRNYNVFFAILDDSGALSYGPVNLTNNGAWGDWSDEGVPRFFEPRIAATADNRFMMAWQREQTEAYTWVNDIFFGVRNTDGGVVKGVTRFAGGDYYRRPALAALSGSRALLAYVGPDQIFYAVLDSAGNTIKGETGLGTYGWYLDVVELSNGRVLLAWSMMDWVAGRPKIHFTLLGGSAYDVIAGPTTLQNSAALTGDGAVSVTADGDGHAILTWMDYHYAYRPNLYYALVDGEGTVLTDPMIFRTSQATEPHISTSYTGYGNTSYSWTPPSEVDGVAAFSASTFGGPPGGSAGVHLRYANHGTATATGVVLTATLDSRLTYVGDTSGIVPTVSANDVIWSLPDLGFLDGEGFTLRVQVPPDAEYGTRYPVTLTLASDGPEAYLGDNTDTAEVIAARQVFLPLVLKGYR